MALTRNKKKEVLEKVKDVVSKSGSVVFANFHNLSVSDETQMRQDLREKGIGYTVAKKTLVRKALDDSKIEGERPLFEGELSLAWSQDLTDSAREIYEFQKKFDGNISILGGIFEGKFMNKESMTEIAQIPGMETLRAQFVNVINSPIQGLAIALNAIAENKN